jgi:hypothetical protein
MNNEIPSAQFEKKRRCLKVAFADERSANFTMKKIHQTSTRETQPVRAYQCKICSNWHLTSKPDINELKKEIESLKKEKEDLSNKLTAFTSSSAKNERLQARKGKIIKDLEYQIELFSEKSKKLINEKNEIFNRLIALKKNIDFSLFDDEMFIANVCLSYRHDFGLMSKEDQNKLIFDCKEWMRAIKNNYDAKNLIDNP